MTSLRRDILIKNKALYKIPYYKMRFKISRRNASKIIRNLGHIYLYKSTICTISFS